MLQHGTVRSKHLSHVAFSIFCSLTCCTKKIQTCCHNPSRSSCWFQIFPAPSGYEQCACRLTSEPDEPWAHCTVTLLPLSNADWIMSRVEKMVVQIPFTFFLPWGGTAQGIGMGTDNCRCTNLLYIISLHMCFCKNLKMVILPPFLGFIDK